MKIFVIRHGETDMNKAKRLQGQTHDVELNEDGIAQARASIAALPTDLTLIFSSPLKRALRTAEIVADHFGLPIIFRDDLKEKHYGSLSGKTWEEIHQEDGDGLRAKHMKSHFDYSQFGGETAEDVKSRIGCFLDEVRTNYQHEIPLVVTHAGIVRLMHYILAGREEGEIANASVHEFEI